MTAPRPGNARGAALLTAILITALVTITAAAMATRQQLDIRRTSNLVNGDQAWLYSLGMEAWALQILARDRGRRQLDHDLEGATHTLTGATAGEVLRASGATTFAMAALAHSDLSDAPTDAHHTEVHTVASTGPHAQSGLTAGHFLRASSTTAFDEPLTARIYRTGSIAATSSSAVVRDLAVIRATG